jgi:hypothetical protein
LNLPSNNETKQKSESHSRLAFKNIIFKTSHKAKPNKEKKKKRATQQQMHKDQMLITKTAFAF